MKRWMLTLTALAVGMTAFCQQQVGIRSPYGPYYTVLQTNDARALKVEIAFSLSVCDPRNGLVVFVGLTGRAPSIKMGSDGTAEGTVTKQDAIDFLNKIFKEFPSRFYWDRSNTNQSNFSEQASLDGCTLTIELKWNDQRPGTRGFEFVTVNEIFNLSAVYDEGGSIQYGGYACAYTIGGGTPTTRCIVSTIPLPPMT